MTKHEAPITDPQLQVAKLTEACIYVVQLYRMTLSSDPNALEDAALTCLKALQACAIRVPRKEKPCPVM